MTNIEINGTTYPLKFGLGFMREINKKYKDKAESAGFQRDDAGLMYAILCMTGDKSVEALINVIMIAARSVKDNQLKENDLVEWIENEDTDIDKLFEDVESFFERSNFCKNTLKAAKQFIEVMNEEEAEE